MSSFIVPIVIIIAFLLGGLAVAEYLCRRGASRRGMPWVNEAQAKPTTRRMFERD